MERDRLGYYKELGLSPSCTETEIRKAYRKLAMQWHPDKNKNNHVVATEKFKKISEAYNVLSDPQMRQRYDMGRSRLDSTTDDDFDAFHATFGFADAEKIFQSFFGSSGFGSLFGDDHFFARPLSRQFSSFGSSDFPSLFSHPSDPSRSHRSLGNWTGQSCSMSSSFSSGGRGYSESKSTTTQIINGKRTTKTEIIKQKPDGTVERRVITEETDRQGNVTRREITDGDRSESSRHLPRY